MVKRYLAERTEINENAAPYCNFILEYYITESVCEHEEASGKTIYGLEVVKKHGDCVENSLINEYSLCKNKTALLAKKLCSNKVTPVGLFDVMNDIIGI